MNYQEQVEGPDAVLAALHQRIVTGIWTTMPGIVQKFDTKQITVDVQIAVKAQRQMPDGEWKVFDYPLLTDVPVVLLRGGNFTITTPIKAGDECCLFFAARDISTWWQSGGVQLPQWNRKHDLSDAFALVGAFSLATAIGGYSTGTLQVRSNDGGTYVEVADAQVNVVAPASINATAPEIVLNGKVTINGATAINGPALTHNGTNVGNSHLHSNVTPGPATTGTPV